MLISYQLTSETKRIPIIITNYSLIPLVKEEGIIHSKEMLRSRLDDINNWYADYIIHDHNMDLLQRIYKTLATLINYDLTNVNLRLFYCFIAIELDKIEEALREMDHIDQFILYYDQTDLEVTDIFVRLNGPSKR